jgi:endonuclease YncB( thermonuclease family)
VRRAPAILLCAALLAAARPAEARRGGGRGARAAVLLDGERTDGRFTDGDSFRLLSGPPRGRAARRRGVNALETSGPVHRLGALGGRALLALAQGSAALAAAAAVRCDTAGRRDRYGRLLVACPEAAEALVRAGHAMVLAVGEPPDAALVRLQREAQRAGAGMWAAGAPPRVPTSLHSADERGLGPRGAYDRVVDTRTGLSEARPHARVYRACEEVCLGEGAERACMTYVPRRHRERPACLR